MKIQKKFNQRTDNRKKQIVHKSGEKRNQKVLHKLLVAFLVPIILMIILGVFSYKKASSSLMGKYKESVFSTVTAMTKYFDLMCYNVGVISHCSLFVKRCILLFWIVCRNF